MYSMTLYLVNMNDRHITINKMCILHMCTTDFYTDSLNYCFICLSGFICMSVCLFVCLSGFIFGYR